jgi:hypothetical protein
MPTTKSQALDPHAPQVFRRGTTVTWAVIVTLVLVVFAATLAASETGHGFFPVIAPFAAVAPLVLFAVLGMAWPSVIIRDEVVSVRNAYSSYEVPYTAIKDFTPNRIGLFLTLHDGMKVPVTAYASGGGGRMFGHRKSTERLTSAIEEKVAYLPADTSQDGPDSTSATKVTKTLLAVLSIALLVICVAVVWIAVITY